MVLAMSHGMTMARDARAGVTWLVTRRATRRHFLFKPDELGVVKALYWYVTAVYARDCGIEVHMVEVMSTHIHEVLTDTQGNLSRFMELRNRAFANALKVLLGWPEEVMSKTSANWVELGNAEMVIEEMAYTCANCVTAGLVPTPREWPGARTLPEEVGSRIVRAERPEVYFRASNPRWPDDIELPIVMPALLDEAYESHDDARAAIAKRTAELVEQAHQANIAAGRGYAGAKRVIKAPHHRRANSDEDFGSRNPTFVARGDQELAARLAERRRTFHAAYRKAWTAWNTGDHDVIFPHGTYKMRVVHNARCHPPPEQHQLAA